MGYKDNIHVTFMCLTFVYPLPELRTSLGKVRAELATFFENNRLSTGVVKILLCLLKETERLSDSARNPLMLSCEDATQIRTERLRFYLGAFAVTGLQHVFVLTEKL